MPAIVPSYVAKIARAKKHLVDLDKAVEDFAATEPYTVRTRIEGKKQRKIRRVVFTADPANTDIPIIAADVIYNLRSSLDHLMSALVAKRDRNSAMFPIFFQGVWEAIVPGENQQRTKERMRWASDVKSLSDEAVTVLKRMQPADTDPQDPEAPVLTLLSRLSNRDRHEKLPVVMGGMGDLRVEFIDSNGVRQTGSADPDPRHVLIDETEITDIPDDAVDVKVKGTPLVGISVGAKQTQRYVEIPSRLAVMAEVIETEVFPALMPYVRAE